MAEALTLSREEIKGITGMWQHAAQARALERMKIPHTRRPIDGSVVVGRDAAKRALGFEVQRDPAVPAANDDDGFNWSVRK
ncbi:hypothetical protein H4CHR_04440 [Variovorax sp. PBS-H4]|uniref:DUF4224 domain-containing protein n=1 Tax=Variovorax sp. PBS-H4 TaxID=434008 RepID=UPI001315F90D|nr:DUF4224 domain-containing protein [Variovorax sp. PBS-H4]VTU38493.1 hypothetical protein H4CHR_04440 [Variovorax sp. PBS-H4]